MTVTATTRDEGLSAAALAATPSVSLVDAEAATTVAGESPSLVQRTISVARSMLSEPEESVYLDPREHPGLSDPVLFVKGKAYVLVKEIGEGTFKIASKALTWDGREVVVIRPKAPHEFTPERLDELYPKLDDESIQIAQTNDLIQECEMLRRCESPYVARVEAIGRIAQTAFAIMPLYQHGDLYSALSTPEIRDRLFPKEKFHKTPLQIIQGVVALHEQGVIHRDLKPENVFIGDNGTAIADMGLCTSVEDVAQSIADPMYGRGDSGPKRPRKIAGTSRYLAPETVQLARRIELFPAKMALYNNIVLQINSLIEQGREEEIPDRPLVKPTRPSEEDCLRAIGFNNDNWALGVTLFEYFLGSPINGRGSFLAYLGLKDAPPPTQDKLNAKIAELLEPAFMEDPSKRAWLPILKGLLQIDPERRMTAAEAEKMARELEALAPAAEEPPPPETV